MMNDTHARILAEDLARLMPGCNVRAWLNSAGGIDATATHRVTGRALRLTVGAGQRTDAEEWQVRTDAGGCTTGTTAYGFDAAVLHAYRHHLDFTAEHGPGTAHDYAEAGR